jgi:hypothetical protein
MNRSNKFIILLIINLTLSLLGMMCTGAQAAPCSTSVSPYTLSCDHTGLSWAAGSLVINSGVTLTGTTQLTLNNVGSTFESNGSITNTNIGNGVQIGSNFGQFINNGTITTAGSSGAGVVSSLLTTTLINNGTVTGGFGVGSLGGIRNTGTIANLINTGTINGLNGIDNNMNATITTLTNTGTINGGVLNHSGFNMGGGVFAFVATMDTLNNLQGMNGTTSTPLNFTGVLPTNYNIIINSPTSYGQLAITTKVGFTNRGLTTFGIHSSSTVANGNYTSVLTGLQAPGNNSTTSPVLSATSGTFGVGNWSLSLANAVTNTWDLILTNFPVIVLGPSAADTQQSLVNVAGGLKNTVTQQNTVVNNSLNYDCAVFDKKNACVSVSTRNTSSSADSNLNDTSGVIVGAYRPHPKLRVGLYVDQNSQSSPQGNTITISNNKPLVGFFAVWNQNADDSGIQVKLSAANGQKNTQITRPIVGTSEAGSGSTQLTSQGIQITAKYGFVVKKKGLIRPYLGIRFTENNVAKYTEGSSSSVTAPLSYAGIYTNATTALAGVEFAYKFNPKFTLFASANLESDTSVTNGVISATGVNGLTPINLNSNPAKTRRSAIAGAYYDVAENQRIGLLGIYRQEPSQSESSTTAIATYHIGM